MGFTPVTAPPVGTRGGKPAIDADTAQSLLDLLAESDWVQDGTVYDEAKDAYRTANQYRRALSAYGLVPPNGDVLGCRVRAVEGGFGLFLTLRPPRAKKGKK